MATRALWTSKDSRRADETLFGGGLSCLAEKVAGIFRRQRSWTLSNGPHDRDGSRVTKSAHRFRKVSRA